MSSKHLVLFRDNCLCFHRTNNFYLRIPRIAIYNLVARVIALGEQRPWLGLVTCHTQNILPWVWGNIPLCALSPFAMLDYIAFLSCLEFAVLNSLYQETILKPKQVLRLESAYLEKDLIGVLPTGYGKSPIFHLLPMLLVAKLKLHGNLLSQWRSKGFCLATVDSIVIVVSPLNLLRVTKYHGLA